MPNHAFNVDNVHLLLAHLQILLESVFAVVVYAIDDMNKVYHLDSYIFSVRQY